MAMKKTEIIVIESKPKPPYMEFSLVTHPTPESAIAIYEDRTRKVPKKMYHYIPPSGKFQSWIVKENDG